MVWGFVSVLVVGMLREVSFIKKKTKDRKSFKQCKKTEVVEEKTVMIHVEDDDPPMQYRKGPLDGVKSSLMTEVLCSLVQGLSCIKLGVEKSSMNILTN